MKSIVSVVKLLPNLRDELSNTFRVHKIGFLGAPLLNGMALLASAIQRF